MDAAGLGLADDDYFNGDATQDGGNMARLSASLSSAYVVVGVVVSNSSSSSSSSGGGGRSRRRRRRERGCCSSDQILLRPLGHVQAELWLRIQAYLGTRFHGERFRRGFL
ncbi:hypothetical protein I7I51_02077 [Histoplasma capsulatum]|uniref:Uncharacterized protein n=1 Tax=Ajellomyces capsulatus TaxID=5037 RepID=A0A8A1MGD7_AJECA|nr:hypothetical protein I7I51_02077 [Histoplasma capsulatum]